MSNLVRYELRSIDAWREYEGGWTWNASYHIESGIYLPRDISNRKLLSFLRRNGFLTDASKGRVRVEDANGMGELLEIQARGTGEPLYALIEEED